MVIRESGEVGRHSDPQPPRFRSPWWYSWKSWRRLTALRAIKPQRHGREPEREPRSAFLRHYYCRITSAPAVPRHNATVCVVAAASSVECSIESSRISPSGRLLSICRKHTPFFCDEVLVPVLRRKGVPSILRGEPLVTVSETRFHSFSLVEDAHHVSVHFGVFVFFWVGKDSQPREENHTRGLCPATAPQ